MYEAYEWYIGSKQWQEKRFQRMQIDNHKCVLCGSRYNLQVHHVDYGNLGIEDLAEDLVTLCRNCHKRIHEFKDTPLQERIERKLKTAASKSLRRYVERLTVNFCREYWHTDIANGGEHNLCKCDTLRILLPEYYQRYGIVRVYPELALAMKIISAYRHNKILEMAEQGIGISDICKTGLPYTAVKKVLKNPLQAENGIEKIRQMIKAIEED